MSFLKGLAAELAEGAMTGIIKALREQPRVYTEQEATDEDKALIDSAVAVLGKLLQPGSHNNEQTETPPLSQGPEGVHPADP